MSKAKSSMIQPNADKKQELDVQPIYIKAANDKTIEAQKNIDPQQKLKAVYQKQDKIAPLIEGVIPEQSMKEYYVKLQTIIKEDEEKKSSGYESVSGEKKEVEIAKLFDKVEGLADSKEANKLLILGGAGVGKSTLMQYMAYKWSAGEIWNEKFDYVYRITLKTLLNNEWKDQYEKKELKDSELKCLAHYHLTAGLNKKERAELKLEDLAWPDDKLKVLLLLDGYDEVAHLRTTPEYKDIFEEVFYHNNFILTSRPNAIDNEMKAKFDRKIENTGLDNEGIEQYLKLYFKDAPEKGNKGDKLQEFLKQNSTIKDICKIPVNIAMLCYIWSESGESEVLKDITNMSDLYEQVVDQLGFRYYSKWKYKGAKEEGKDLKGEWDKGNLELSELKVLSHTAYKSMTGGGIEIPDDKRVETLIIKGGLENIKDENGISIRSSINKLRSTLKEQNLGIEDIYRYGVLKTEGLVIEEKDSPVKLSSPSKKTGDKIDDTKLQHQNYSFIHLTFQEYLTANYFKDKLTHGTDKEKEQISQYIAEHRNEPRYLMTLKFLSGIITADTSAEGNEAARMFWEAVTCNVDGVIELGAEAKVLLLMHMLSQAKDSNSEFDSRIPNKQILIDLIDLVVLDNLLEWGANLKETDYITDNIKEALQEVFVTKGLAGCAKKIKELLNSPKISKELKTAVEKSTKAKAEVVVEHEGNLVAGQVIEIMGNLANKISIEEQQKFVANLIDIIAEKGKNDWQLIKVAIETIEKVLPSVKGSGKEQVEKPVDLLLNLITDSNLSKTAIKAAAVLIKQGTGNPALTKIIQDKFSTLFADGNANVRYAAVNGTVELLKLRSDDTTLLQGGLDKFSTLFADGNANVRKAAVNGTVELLKLRSDDTTLLQGGLDKVSTLFADSDSDVRKAAVNGTVELLKLRSDDTTLLQGGLDKVSTLFADGNANVRKAAVNGTVELLKLRSDDTTLLQGGLDKFSTLFADSDSDVRKAAVNGTVELLKLRSDDTTLLQGGLDKFSTLFADGNANVRYAAVNGTVELLKLRSDDTTLLQGGLDKFSTLFADSSWEVRYAAVNGTVELLKLRSDDTTLLQGGLDKFSTLFADGNANVRYAAVNGTVELLKLRSDDTTLLQGGLDKFSTLFADGNANVRYAAVNGTVELLKLRSDDTTLLQGGLDKVSTLFADSSWEVRYAAVNGTVELLKLRSDDTTLLQGGLDKVSTLFADGNANVRYAAVNGTVELLKLRSDDTTLLQGGLDKVSTLFADGNANVRYAAVNGTVELLKLRSDDTTLLQGGLDKFSTLFADGNANVRYAAVNGTVELLKLRSDDTTLLQGGLDKFSTLFADSDSDVRKAAVNGTVELLKLRSDDTTLLQGGLDKFSTLFADSSWEVRYAAVNGTVELLKLRSDDTTLLQGGLDKFSTLFADGNANVRKAAVNGTVELLKLRSDDTTLLQGGLDKFSTLFADGNANVRKAAVNGTVELLKLRSDDTTLLQGGLDKVSTLFADSDSDVRKAAVNGTVELLKLRSDDTTLLQGGLDKVSTLFADSSWEVRYAVLEVIAELVSNVLDTTNLKKYLNHNSKEIRDNVVNSLVKSFKELLVKLESLEGFLKDEANLKINIINEKLFSNKIELSVKELIEKELIKISGDNPDVINSNEAFANLKDILAQALNKIGSKASHQLIEPALAIIGYENIAGAEGDKKELITLARKVINRQIEHLDDKGLEWFNAKLSTLSNLSRESKIVFKKLYHKILEDLTISQLDKELIIQFINQGLTTSLTRQDEIIFEGKKYKLQGVNVKGMLEEIAKAVISKDYDILAGQYKDHQPIFQKKEGNNIGMKTASSDIAEVVSIVDKSYSLESNKWLFTSLINEETGEELLVLEQRSSMGDHLLYAIGGNRVKILQLNDVELYNANNKGEELFGKYTPKTVYKGEAKILEDIAGKSIADDIALTSADKKLSVKFKDIKGEHYAKQKYFQQELLKLGHEDRLNYIDKELEQKLNDNAKKLQAELESYTPKLKTEDIEKLTAYYKDFVSTFASVYTTSQAVASGQLSIDTSNLGATVLSTLASFAPFGIGDIMSSGIDKINDYITGNKMVKEAKIFKTLGMDAVDVSSKIGKVGLNIVLDKAAQRKIIEAASKDPDGIIGKLKGFIEKYKDKLADYNLAEKELYKTPAAALGQSDANKLIKKWLVDRKEAEKSSKGIIAYDIVDEFSKTILPEAENNKVEKVSKIVPVVTKSQCCNVFSIVDIEYDNPILNHPKALNWLVKATGLSQNDLISRFDTFDREFVEESLLAGNIRLLEESL